MLYRAANTFLSAATLIALLCTVPFHVLERGSKFFKIDIGGKADSVSVDRLKPAHLDPDQPVQVAQPRAPRTPAYK